MVHLVGFILLSSWGSFYRVSLVAIDIDHGESQEYHEENDGDIDGRHLSLTQAGLGVSSDPYIPLVEHDQGQDG